MIPIRKQYFLSWFFDTLKQFWNLLVTYNILTNMGLGVKLTIIGFILALLRLKVVLQKSKNLKNLYQILKQLNIQKPTELAKMFVENSSSFEYGLVEGVISAGDTCTAMLNPKIKTYYSKLYLKKKMQLKQALHNIVQYIRSKRPSFLKIKDNQTTINIFETTKTKHFTTHFTRRSNHQMISSGKWQKLTLLKQILSFFRDNRIPQITQEILQQSFCPDNSSGIVFGLFKRTDAGIICQKPMIIAKKKRKILLAFKGSLQCLSLQKVLLGIAIGIFSIILLHKLCQYYLKLKKRRQMDSLYKYKIIEVKSRICDTCHQSMSNIINEPCGHFVECSNCSLLSKQRCKQCHKIRKNVKEVFLC